MKVAVFLATTLILFLSNPKPVYAQVTHLPPISYEITVSASVGEPKLSLFGYGPASSLVKLTGMAINEQTTADERGYFKFNKVFLTVLEDINKLYYPEICLQSFLADGGSTQPTCIPPLLIGKYDYEIGPVTLSPTLILDKGDFLEKEQVRAYGRTTPQTQVEVYLARESRKKSFFEFIKDALAYNIPTYHTISDEAGNFEFNLPSDSPDSWRIFTAAKILGNASPKSNTLTFKVLPWYFLLFNFLQALLLKLKPYWYFILITAQILLIILLIRKLKTKSSSTLFKTQT